MHPRRPIPEHPSPASQSTQDSYVSKAAPWVGWGLMARPWRGGSQKDRLAYPVSVGKNFSLLHDPSVPNHSNLHITNSLSTTNTARIVAA